MLSRTVRSVLLAGLMTAALAAPAQASHPPTQHQEQYLTLAEAMTGSDFTQQIRASASTAFECEDGMAGPYPCENVDLLGSVPLPMMGGATGNDIWGWTDPETGREYAIMGTSHAAGFVDVTNPQEPRVVGILPTAGIPDQVLWRSIRVDGHYAYVVSEITDHGMQVFDLHRLRDATGPLPEVFDADANYTEVSNTHTIWIDEPNDTAYLVGTNTCGANGENGGLHMVDISDPLNPAFAGCATVDTFAEQDPDEPNNYVHETWCETYHGPDADYQGREICFGSNENAVVIYDTTDKANPVVISETTYPNASYTHQGVPTGDHKWFMFNDELDEQQAGIPTTTYIMEIDDLDDPPVPVAYEHPSATIDHNMFIHQGNRLFQSNYSQGLRILEFSDESLSAGQLDEVAYFDVIPAVDVAEFAGTWSNYRFPGSGNVVVSTIENAVNGLMILRPTLDGEPPAGGPDDGAGGGGAAKQPDPPAKPGSKAKKCTKLKKRTGTKKKRKCAKTKRKRKRR